MRGCPAVRPSFWRSSRDAGFLPPVAAPLLAPAAGMVPTGTRPGFTGTSAGVIWYTLDGTDPRQPGGAVAPGAHRWASGAATETVLSAGSRWRWYSDATGLGSSAVVEGQAGWSAANWKHPAFDDSKWAEGPAQLGYGEGDEATVLPFGPATDKWVTACFRRRFVVTQPDRSAGRPCASGGTTG